MISNAATILRQAADLHEAKTREYGAAPWAFGEIMQAILPAAEVRLRTAADFNRFHLLTQMVVKLARYGANFATGGHEDSLRDLAVYAAMLQSYDASIKERQCRTAD